MTDIAERTGPRFTTSNLILWGTIAGSIALSIVSAYETWLGLDDFMPQGFIGAIMAFILTFGVQVILFAISWSIAEYARDGFKANLWRISIWIMCAFFSGYFSFYGFFQGTGGRDDVERSNVIQTERSRILNGIQENLVTGLNTQHQDQLVNNATYRTWIEELRSVIDAANGAQAQIEANSRVESARLRDQQRELRDERDTLTNERSRFSVSSQTGAQRLTDLRREVNALEAQLATQSREVQRLEIERDALQRQFEVESSDGVGPRARAILANQQTNSAALTAAETLLSGTENSLERLRPQLQNATATAQGGVAEQRINEIDSRLDGIKDEIALIDTKIEDLSDGIDFDFQTQSATLTRLQSNLEGQDYEAYAGLLDQCSTLKQQLTDANVGQSTAGVTCANSTVLATVNALKSVQSNIGAYDEQCLSAQPAPEKREGQELFTLDPLISHLEGCVQYEPDRSERDDLVTYIGSMKTGRGDSAKPINQAAVALFKDQQGNAVLSFVFAAIVDLLVLLCALVGKNVGLPESVRAIDKLINLMRKPQPERPGVEAIAPLPEDRQQLDMLDPIINRLIRDGYAEFEVSDINDSSQLVMLKGARQYLSHLRSMEISEQRVNAPIKSETETSRTRGGRRRPQEPI
ncbi:hypothetical protein [uncultured Tateyamaria sp.]|uniref:hypothetical protein n=1 Tax=uncultured Tateyamaria sp. TaxID=455651 RepID=UPI0026322D8B|nr:hypothetical protein [uncultured Tateyamaria sp.]